MLATLLLALCVPAPLQEREKESPSPALVEETVERLEQAYEANDRTTIQAAMEAATQVLHPAVIREVRRALQNKDLEVVLAGVHALRWMDHDDVLDALHGAAKDKRLMKEAPVAGAILKAIGQHADPRSIAILAQDPTESLDRVPVQARILGLGRIRSKDSVAALMKLMAETAGAAGHRRFAGWMEDFRLSLMILTGVDQGKTPEHWERWWRENQKTFVLPPEPPPLPKAQRTRWNVFWGNPKDYERSPLREDRGGEAPGRGQDLRRSIRR